MKYISCEKPGHLSLKEKEPPVNAEGNILLKVKVVGICGTDLHAYKGNQPFFSYPRILGHELATEILSNGNPGSGLRTGDRVVVVPYVNCETCEACLAGKTNCCQNLKVLGVHTDGGMQEIISVPERLLIPANDLSMEEIAIVEPISIGAHALRRSQIKKDEIMVVIGCGPIGMGLIQLGKYIGAHVIALDTNDYRLAQARDHFGADGIVNVHQSPIEAVKKLSNGHLAHVVFDASGSKQAIESTPDYMRHGGCIVLVGLLKGELSFHHPSLHAKEGTLMCSRNATIEDFEFTMNAFRKKKFNVSSYITREESYNEIVKGFDKWSGPDSKDIKIITRWESM